MEEIRLKISSVSPTKEETQPVCLPTVYLAKPTFGRSAAKQLA